MQSTVRSKVRQPQPQQRELDALALHIQQGETDAAQVLAQSLTERFPGHGFAWKVLGVVLLRDKRFEDSAAASRRAIELLPDDASPHNNLGTALLGLEQTDAAEVHFRHALQIAPGYAKAHFNLSKVCRIQGKLQEAQDHCRAALESDPHYAAAHFALGNTLELQNHISEAVASYRTALALEPGNAAMFSDMLHLMSHDVHTSAVDNLQAHRQFGVQLEGPLKDLRAPHPNSKEPDRRIKLGFVSSDAYDHALANYLEPLFRLLNKRPGLEVHLYYTHAKEDAVTARLRGYFEHWHDVAPLDDEALAQRIRSDAIDILVDVNGHTVLNRLGTFARKPAPVQMSWLGYLGTSGLQAMDYYVADPYWIPPGELDWQFLEKMAYLPSAVVFEPNASAPPVHPLPALANGFITFGSFNRHNKINDAVIALWSLLMQQVPGSQLKLGGIPADHWDDLKRRFEAQGVAAQRLTFFGRTIQTDYLALHHEVDFCLDTFPFCGGATSAHAAWMGVPTLTLLGELPASRLGATEMHHLGLDGFVAHSIDGFLEQGLYWATHTTELAQLRAGMRERFSNSPLGQTVAYANHFETMLRTAWQHWCADLAPESFGVAPIPLPAGNPPEPQDEPSEATLETLLNWHARQEYAQVEALARQLTLDYPEHGAGWKYLGAALRQLGRIDESLEVQKHTVQLRPQDYEAHFNLATELQQQGQFDEAVRSYLQALSLQPNNPTAYNNLSNIFKLMGLFPQAEMYCRQALALKPDMVIAQNNLGNALHAQGKFAEAETCYREALALKPNWAEAYNNLAICLKDQGYGSEAKEAYRKALSLKDDWAAAHSNLLFSLSLDVQTEPDELHREHIAFGEKFEPPLQARRRRHGNDRQPERPLQIGFVSGDLYDHALANFLEPLFQGLAQVPELTLHAYYTHIYEDATTQRLRTHFHAWNQVVELSDDALAEKIRADQIDILIDLSGHTAHNRMLTFARKPAPVQASYLGYLGTSGLQSMDYFLCDTFWVPPGQMDWQFTEKMAYLPGAVVFQPSPFSAEVNALPALQNGYITFGSFNRPNKLNPSVIALWALLLQAVPTARMVLGGIAPERQEELFRRFVEHGVDIERLTFFPRANIQDYLALHHHVDFCLDTFPYGGGATNANAAWMGVPTLCLAGESPASRFGPAEMHSLGLDGFIADGIDDFVAKGVYWSGHVAELAELRSSLRTRFRASPMGQPQRFADGWASMLRTMWRRWCQGETPTTLYVEQPTAGQSTDAPAKELEASAAQQAELLPLVEQRRWDDALALVDQALANSPADASLHNSRGVVLMSLERLTEAEAALRASLAVQPDYSRALVNLATVLRLQDQPQAAEGVSRQALALDPTDASAYIQLGNALEVQGKASEAQACYYHADMAHEPRRDVAHSNVLYLMNHDVLVEPQHLFAEHLAFGAQFEAPLRAQWQAHANSRDPHRPLKIGFVSGDFCHHALNCFIEPAIKALSTRPQLSLYAYSSGVATDAVTQRMQWHFHQWRDVALLSHDALAAQIRADGIDVLIDLSGHTARNRLLTLARKPAPIQVGWIGHLGTSGLQAMDYYFCDAHWLPAGQQAWPFTEQLAYLPAAVQFTPEPLAPPVNALPALRNGYVTFGSFNRSSKINDAVIALWSLVLQRVANARMVLAGIGHSSQEGIAATFAAHGIAAERLRFVPRLGTADYLALHHEVDCCLDTFPHGGGATTAHAAWMGLPSVCLVGDTPASRFGAAIMQHLDLPQCVAHSIESYVDEGVALATDLEQLSALRAGLRSRFVRSDLAHMQRFAQGLEDSLRTMWSRWCQDLPATEIACLSDASPASGGPAASAPAAPQTTLTIVSATQRDEAQFWQHTALGQSLRQHMGMDARIGASVAFSNKRGLPEVFNAALDRAADGSLLVFMHDDVWIDEPFLVDAVQAGLAQFDVIGIAGNHRRVYQQPAWPFVDLRFTWDDKRHLSGCVGHGQDAFGHKNYYGAAPAACALLDGVLMAARTDTLRQQGVRFDTRFDFHFYDLDFCRSATAAALTLGTWPLSTTHQSGGAFGSSHWHTMYDVYKQKWAHDDPEPAQLRLFVGHKPPDFGLWPGFGYCSQAGGAITLPRDPLLDALTSDVLSEYHSLFLLRRALLAQGLQEGSITICQHRRFVLNAPLGEVAVNLPSSWVIEASVAAHLDTALLAPNAGGFLIASPLGLGGSVLEQFHLHHPLRDMLRFYADLLDQNLLSADDVHNILSMKLLIPAPSCGTLPLQAFLDIYAVLEQCALAWHASGYLARDDYQKRISGFLLERLHSYLLISHMEKAGVDIDQAVGYTTVVSEGNRIVAGR